MTAPQGLLENNSTEAPDTINILHRFNVLQEIALGLLRRASPIPLGSPISLYVNAVFWLFGVSMASAFLLATQAAGSLWGGFTFLALYHANWFEMNRVWTAPVLRENWSIPFFTIQLQLLSARLAQPVNRRALFETLQEMLPVVAATVACLVTWQFAHWLMASQLIAFHILYGMGYLSPKAALQLAGMHGVSFHIGAFLTQIRAHLNASSCHSNANST
jgi:hypothetical protein